MLSSYWFSLLHLVKLSLIFFLLFLVSALAVAICSWKSNNYNNNCKLLQNWTNESLDRPAKLFFILRVPIISSWIVHTYFPSTLCSLSYDISYMEKSILKANNKISIIKKLYIYQNKYKLKNLKINWSKKIVKKHCTKVIIKCLK